MPIPRLLSSAILTAILLMLCSLYLNSPYQLWLAMAGLGVITGLVFKTGQRYVISGYGMGIALTLIREVMMYGTDIIQVTALAYAAGYLFAVATTITTRMLLTRFNSKRLVMEKLKRQGA